MTFKRENLNKKRETNQNKHLNKNFLTEFKNHIKRSNEFENKHTEEDQNLSIAE